MATNIPLKSLIGLGWPQTTSGGPAWIQTDGYDVSAKEPAGPASDHDFALMMQNLLKKRFGLQVHMETREFRGYALRPAKNGLKLPNAIAEPCFYGTNNPPPGVTAQCGAMNATRESIVDERISMQWLTGVLGWQVGRTVIDKTGFTGSFQVKLEFSSTAPDGAADGTKSSIFAALEQIGLRLDSEKGSEEVLVIDHVERPTGN